MKRQASYLLLFQALVFAFLITGCKKDAEDDAPPTNNNNSTADTIPPVITLGGSSAVTVTLNGTYTDAGATASDAHDGTVSVSSDLSASNPDVDHAAIYTITYSAVDSAGNTGHATRTVTVRNDAYYLEGTYDVVEDGNHFPQTIAASLTVNNRIVFSQFAAYTNNSSMYANVSGSTLFLPSQNAVGIGTNGCTHAFNQAGPDAVISVISFKAHFTIKFSDEQLQGGGGCVATSPVVFEDAFTQQ